MTFDSLANIPDAGNVAQWVDENGDGMRCGRHVRGTRRTTAMHIAGTPVAVIAAWIGHEHASPTMRIEQIERRCRSSSWSR
jgi:hypothetical protein